MKKGQLKALAIVIVVIVGGFGIYRWRSSSNESNKTQVETIRVETGEVAPTLAITGYVSSVDEREVNAAGSGPVLEVLATVGETVSAGDELFKVESGTPGESVNIAFADLTAARTKLQKLRVDEASDEEIADQEEVVEDAEAQYSQSVDNRYSTITYSPIDGTVIAVNAQIGDEPGSGSSTGGAGGAQSTALVLVADLTRLQVEAAIDQADISKLVIGQLVDVTLDALPDKKLSGQVVSIDQSPETNQNVVTYNAFISIDELDPGIRLGMSANLEIHLEKRKDVLYVPNVAVRASGNKKYVTKIIDGEPTEVPVETGLVASERTEITSGLSKGDEISIQSFNSNNNSQGRSGRAFGGGFRMGGGGPPH